MITRPTRYLAILFLVSAILFLLDQTKVFSAGADFTKRAVVAPAVKTGTSLVDKAASTIESLFLFRNFIADFGQTESERDHYRGEYFRLLAVEEENRFLRGALELESNPQTNLVLAEVIAFDPLRPNQFLIINRGQNDGIAKGDPVILSGRVLVGRVEEVLAKTSRLELITSEASRVVTRLERSGTNAIVTGSPSGALLLDLVLPETGLEEGEIIVSSGLEGNIPPNLLIGQVSKVLSEGTASFKKAVVRPFFNSRDLRQVFIMK